MPTVYIETSIISFLRENPKAATDSILRQQMTRAWWDFHRERYELLTAQYVVDEASAGNTVFAAERLKYLAQIPLLPIGEDIDRLASEILSRPQPSTLFLINFGFRAKKRNPSAFSGVS